MFLGSFVKNNLLFRIMDSLKRKSPSNKYMHTYPVGLEVWILLWAFNP